MTQEVNRQQPSRFNWLANSGLLGAIGAFVGASCCVLPLILFNLGVSSAVIGQLSFFARFREEFLITSVFLIVAGVLFAFRSGRRPSKGATFSLGLAVVLVFAAYLIPFYEGDLLVLFGFRGQ